MPLRCVVTLPKFPFYELHLNEKHNGNKPAACVAASREGLTFEQTPYDRPKHKHELGEWL